MQLGGGGEEKIGTIEVIKVLKKNTNRNDVTFHK